MLTWIFFATKGGNMSDKTGPLAPPLAPSSVLGNNPELTAQEQVERREALLAMAWGV